MKKEHLRKASMVILKARFVGYWRMVLILLSNIAYDVSMLVSRLFDIFKLILLLIFGFITIPVMIFCSPVILFFYLPFSTWYQLNKFKSYYAKGYLPAMHKLKTKVLPKRKKHQKYCIEKGFITEYFINKLKKSERAIIADVNGLLGPVDHHRIPKVHVLHLLTKMEELNIIMVDDKKQKGSHAKNN